MMDNGVEPNVVAFSTLIKACAQSGNVEAAEKWLRTMMDSGVEPDVVSFSTVINACAQAGNVQAAET